MVLRQLRHRIDFHQGILIRSCRYHLMQSGSPLCLPTVLENNSILLLCVGVLYNRLNYLAIFQFTKYNGVLHNVSFAGHRFLKLFRYNLVLLNFCQIFNQFPPLFLFCKFLCIVSVACLLDLRFILFLKQSASHLFSTLSLHFLLFKTFSR